MLRYYLTLHLQDPIKTIDDDIMKYRKDDTYEIEEIYHMWLDIVLSVLHAHDISADEVSMWLIDILIARWEKLLRGYGAINTMFPDEDFIKETREYLLEQDQKWLL